MSNPPQPSIQLTNTPDYRESYANSVQVRVNVWDFFLIFGTLQQQDETRVDVRNFQGIYLSPQQAKALYTILQQNLVNYENTFGEIKLDPRMGPGAGSDSLGTCYRFVLGGHGFRGAILAKAELGFRAGFAATRLVRPVIRHSVPPQSRRRGCEIASQPSESGS